MAVPNQYISNGTCYFGRGEKAPSQYFPCGNEAVRPASCCQRGDLCLDKGACYNGEFGVTYLLGCTDSNYSDPTCPNKGSYANVPWTGLVYCNGTSNEWTACSQKGNPTDLRKGDPCWCPSTSRTVAITAPATIPYVGSLPTQLGQTIAWQVGFFPDPPSITSGTTTNPPTSSGPTPTSSSSTTSPPSQPTEAPSTGLTSGQQAGIGVGAALGGLVLIAVLVFLFIKRRKRMKGSDSELESSHPVKGDLGGNSPGASTIPPMPDTPGTVISEADGRAARPWSMRSELGSSSTPLSMAEIQESAANSKASTPVTANAAHSGTPPSAARPGTLSPVFELQG